MGPPEYETKTKGFFDMSDVMNKAAEVSVGLDQTMEEEIPDSMSTFTDDISSDDNSEGGTRGARVPSPLIFRPK